MTSDEARRQAAEQLQQGLERHRAGQFGLAQSHYQRAAKLDPDNPNVWQSLGVVALQQDHDALAAKHLRRCVELQPDFAEGWNNLGIACRRLGRYGEAIDAFRRALGVRGKYVEACFNLALACEAAGQPGEAERAYRQALQWRPNDANSAGNLGNLLRRLDRLGEALPWLELGVRLQPQSAQVHGNYSFALGDAGRYREAIGFAESAVRLAPEQAAWWRALGVAQRLLRLTTPAVASLRRALELEPDDDVARCELGMALLEDGRVEEARAVLARVRRDTFHGERMRWAIAMSLPSVYRDEVEVDAERERFARGLEEIDAGLRLDTPERCAGALEAVGGVSTFLLHYQDRDNTALQNRYGDIVQRVTAAALPELTMPCPPRERAAGERIRVGIASSHLSEHTVSRYFGDLLLGLDPARFDLRVWYSGEVLDAQARAFAERAGTFEHVNETAWATARKIRAANLDVLVFPEVGMDPRHGALGALRLAPVQCLLYGHPATSGLTSIDWFLGGAALEPAGAQAHYREKLFLLPGLGATPRPRATAVRDDWVQKYTGGAAYLLCLQNHLKLPPSFDATLARIVRRSGAKLGFFVRNEGVGARFRERIEAAFREQGLEPARDLIFFPTQEFPAFLGAIARASLVLDSPGFSGGATSLDAFGVGTPVLTFDGALARGRQTAGMLALMGIEGLTARDVDDYVEKATALLGAPEELAAYRERIAARRAVLFESASTIAAFAAFLETATKPPVASTE